MRLPDKVAVITGAANGIGRAMALRFAGEGASIVLADKDTTQGERTAEEIRRQGGQALFHACDVGREEDIRATLSAAQERFGSVDILVNDAAWQLNKPLLETSAEEFSQVLNVNVTGSFIFMREAAKLMIARGRGGAILNFASSFAIVGSPGYFAYHASKGAIASMTRAAAIALLPYGIRVNSIAPGTVDTPGLHDGARDTGDEARGLQSFMALQPMKRFGRPEEIANVALLLVSDEASFVDGSMWVVDGAYTI
ncbi:MAG TPA: SDR family oxidoreductase [Candidatus Mailhella merdavium]|nr:SDR family oxidoreductase [Candidatus Mailhella merdavium]